MNVRDISPTEAADKLKGLSKLDPRGVCMEGDLLGMCLAGRCLLVENAGGWAVVVVVHTNGVHWIDAAKGEGMGMTEAIESAMRAIGAREVGFQTARPGLVKKAEALGYEVTGWIMKWKA